jgi:hypothetical protein
MSNNRLTINRFSAPRALTALSSSPEPSLAGGESGRAES